MTPANALAWTEPSTPPWLGRRLTRCVQRQRRPSSPEVRRGLRSLRMRCVSPTLHDLHPRYRFQTISCLWHRPEGELYMRSSSAALHSSSGKL
jgi:hypothetical protein